MAETLKRWWWLTTDHADKKCDAALAWETIRRTKSYPALWRKCCRERSVFFPDKDKPKLAEFFRLIHLSQKTKTAISELCFKLIFGRFDPNLTWLELSHQQRLTMQGYVVAGGEAVKANLPITLPRQIPQPPFALSIGLCEVQRSPTGQLSVRTLTPDAQPVEEVMRFPFFQKLTLVGRCLCIYFDTRCTRQQLLEALRGERQFWKPDPCAGSSRLKRDKVHVIPSAIPPFAIMLAPATCDAVRLRAAFHTQLKAAEHRKWFRRCVDHWKTLRMEFPEAVRNRDGSPKLNYRGFPLYKKVTRPLFDPEKHLPPKQRSTKSARRVDLWIGLAANDIRKARLPLGKQSEEGQFLLRHCNSVDGLRNHQRSAKAWLNELDEAFGRLDKNLDHWIKENKGLSELGLFTAAAVPPTSKLRKTIIPRKAL